MARSTAAVRTASAARAPVLPMSKAWALNGTSTIGSTAAIDLSARTKIVVSGWCRLTGTAASILLEFTTNYNSDNGGFVISPLAGTNKLSCGYFRGAGYSQWETAALTRNRWAYFSAVFDRTVAAALGTQVYINGLISGANTLATATAPGVTPNFANAALYVGARAGVAVPMSGQLKDLRIDSFTSFSAADAMTLFQGGTPASCTPLHRWRGEDTSTSTAVDEVGGKTITWANLAHTTERPSSRRRAVIDIPYSLLVNGSSGYANCADTFDKAHNSAFSVSVWIHLFNIAGSGGPYAIAGHYNGTKGWLIAAPATSSVRYLEFAMAGTGAVDILFPYARPGWHHVTFTYDGSSSTAGVRCYVDGALQTSSGPTTNTLTSGVSGFAAPFGIGVVNTTVWPFLGNLARLRMHSRELTAAEVADLYYDDKAVAVDGEWLMSEGTGAVLTGTQGGANGTITTPAWSTNTPSKARSYGSEAEYVAMIAADGAAYHWKMDEASGNFAPTIGAITLNATAMTYRQAGRFSDRAAQFNGATSTCQTASAVAYGGATRVVIEALVFIPPHTGVPGFVWESGTPSWVSDGFTLQVDGGFSGASAKGMVAWDGNVGTGYYEFDRVPAGQWVHIAEVIDFTQSAPNEGKVYVDGVELPLSGVSALTNNNSGSLADKVLYVGARTASIYFQRMKMQHLAIYTGANSTLAQIQQRALYAQRFKALAP